MSRQKNRKEGVEESEERMSETSWGNDSLKRCNFNNGNSLKVKEDGRMTIDTDKVTFEKGLTVENFSSDGWKIYEISGDDFGKSKENQHSKLYTRKENSFEQSIKQMNVLSSATSETQQNMLNKPDFNYPQQSATAAYLNKKYSSHVLSFNDQETFKRTMTYLHRNWLNQTTCDALITTQNGDILTHQLVLASHSPTLEAIFDKNKKPLPQLIQLSMTDYPRDIICEVLQYLYTCDIKVDCKNIANLIAISRQLDFPEIINKCGVFLTKTYNHDNIFLHFSVAANNHMKNSKNYLLKVIALNFSLLCQHNHFLYIPFHRLNEIISHESMTSDELDVLQALIRWFDFNRAERLQYSESLFSKVKFELINPEVIASQVEVHDWLFNSKSNKNFIAQAYKYHALAAVGESCKSSRREKEDDKEENSVCKEEEGANEKQTNNNSNKMPIEQMNAYIDRIKERRMRRGGEADEKKKKEEEEEEEEDEKEEEEEEDEVDLLEYTGRMHHACNKKNKEPNYNANNNNHLHKNNNKNNKLFGKSYKRRKDYERGCSKNNNKNNNNNNNKS